MILINVMSINVDSMWTKHADGCGVSNNKTTDILLGALYAHVHVCILSVRTLWTLRTLRTLGKTIEQLDTGRCMYNNTLIP